MADKKLSRSEAKRLEAGAPEKLAKAYFTLLAKYEALQKQQASRKKPREEKRDEQLES